ncbi:hypothetical protein GGX14DRAFT_538898 [Mycena pura]|uniref:C2 domain-containing protein n=1 Tax=Mycena pura TaxID=153505 RepID=A0AAD7E4X6_9AGAR|nr:hypothetical protein GGX14DRAFT_538898 [Mycena pura]
MSSPEREIGTLIVIVLKAQHLPNKRNIGKQDPYCSVAVNGEKQRTKVLKRGGQHPEWDDELRFTLYEDDSVTTTGPNSTPPPPPPKDGKRKIKGGSIMKLSCFADDPREPDLIGQADVDLTEVLTTGETDEWFTLTNKDKFAGKVYLELTFWSNEAPPEKKAVQVEPKRNKEYSGPGVFIASNTPGAGLPRVASTGSAYTHSRRQSDSAPPSTLRASNSLAHIDYYSPPYEHHRSRVASFSAITNDFGDLAIGDPSRRRESFTSPPPQSTIYDGPSSSSVSFSTYPPQQGYEPSMPEAASMYPYERPLTPPGHAHEAPVAYTQAPYRPPYDSGSREYNPPAARGPRYSMPTPSGFRLSSSSSSSFVPLPSHPSEPSGFSPHLPPTPAPLINYAQSHVNPPVSYPPAPSQTPGPLYAPPLPPSSSFHTFPPSQSFQPPFSQQYNPPPPAQTPAPVTQSGYPLPPSPTNNSTAPSLSHSNSLSSSAGPGSRPLPPQPVAPPSHQYTLPLSASQTALPGSYSPTHPSSSTFQDSHPLPPPHQNMGHQPFDPNPPYQSPPAPPSHPPPHQNMGHQPFDPNPPYQSPPAPPSHPNGLSPRRQSSLPPTPNHLQQPSYLPHPPPPPPPLQYSVHNPPPPPPPLPAHPAAQTQPYYPGPPPRPPAQVESQLQWSQPPQVESPLQWSQPPPPPQNSYPTQAWS